MNFLTVIIFFLASVCCAVDKISLCNNEWLIIPHYHYDHSIREYYTILRIEPKESNPREIILLDITIWSQDDKRGSKYSIEVKFHPKCATKSKAKKKKSSLPFLFKELPGINKCVFTYNNSLSENGANLSRYITLFYEHSLIDEYVIAKIKLFFTTYEMRVVDFERSPELLLRMVNWQIGENPTSEEFKDVAIPILNKVTDSVSRQNWAWAMAQAFMDQKEVEKSTAIAFLSMITEPTLPFFISAKLELAELLAAEKNDDMPENRNLVALKCLLTGGDHPDIKNSTNLRVKSLIYGNKVDTLSLPAPLQDISLTTDSVIRLLLYIKELEGKKQ